MSYLVPSGFGGVAIQRKLPSLSEGETTAWFPPPGSPIRQNQSVSLGEISHLPQHPPFPEELNGQLGANPWR